MSNLPSHLVPAIRARRIAAGVLNLLSLGLVSLLDDAVVGDPRSVYPKSLLLLGSLTILWLLCLLNRKSIGAVFCMLEIRGTDGARPTVKQMLLRSGPVYILAVALFFPSAGSALWLQPVKEVLGLSMLLALFTSGIIGLVTQSSMLDRLSNTVVLQLNLPDHAKPRVGGIRII
jgi:hypothetical protein